MLKKKPQEGSYALLTEWPRSDESLEPFKQKLFEHAISCGVHDFEYWVVPGQDVHLFGWMRKDGGTH